jgi:hypothetical protein
MFWEGMFFFPLMLLYTFISYTFRAKALPTSQTIIDSRIGSKGS